MEFRLRYLAPRYWPTAVGLVLLRLFEPLPYRVLVWLGRALGAILRLLPIAFVRTARRNLELCLPELDAPTRERVLGEHFRSLGIALFETAMAWWSSDRRIRELTELEGAEHLERALRAGHGAILLSAHFTTLELGARALCARMPMSVMYRPTKNELLGYFLTRNRRKHTRRAIPRDDIRTLISTLGANEPVWYAPDQSYRKKGAEMVLWLRRPKAELAAEVMVMPTRRRSARTRGTTFVFVLRLRRAPRHRSCPELGQPRRSTTCRSKAASSVLRPPSVCMRSTS